MTPDKGREGSKRRRSDASPDNASPQSGDEREFSGPTAASCQDQQPIDLAWHEGPPLSAEEPESLVPAAHDALQHSPTEADVGPPPAPETTASAPEVRVARDHIQHLGGWSEEEIAGWSDEGVLLADAILVGSARKLLRAFEDNPKMALWVILRARLESELRERLSESLAWALLVAELQPQARAAEVRLELLAAGAWLVESELKPRALVALLDEAQAHGKYGRSVVSDVLPSFSWPELDRFLDQAGGRGGAAWEVFIEGTERVAPGILTGRRGGNAQSLLSRFAQLLTDVRVEEWVKERLVRILRSCASPSTDGADLARIVMELGRGTSAAVAEELARRAYVAVLREVDTNVRSWAAATEWLIEHPSAVRGDPSAGRLYLTIVRLRQILELSGLRPERVSDYRVRALRCLAELAPIALPEQVEEIIKQLYERFSNQAKEPDPAVRAAASDALSRIKQRIREAPPEIGAPEWTSWPTPPGEAIIRFATSPRFPPPISLPIQDRLTVSPGSGPIPPVLRMDASQRSSGPTAAPSPDLDLSSFQFTTNSGEDGFTPTRFSILAIAVPADQSELVIPHESLGAASLFARSTEMNRDARGVFQEELADLAGRVFTRDRLEELMSQINQKCESLSSVLREPGGQLVTLRIGEASDQVKMVPLHDSQAVIRSQVLPPFEVVSIESLSGPEKLVVRARMLGEGQAGLLTTEQRSRGGKAAAARMTAEERRERASKAAKIQSANMTPEQLKERASKAAKARHDRRHARGDE